MLEERDWELLVKRIKKGECTPFLGAGVCSGLLPLGADIAREWAKDKRFPLEDSCGDLAKVSQYLAVEFDSAYPKNEIAERFKTVAPPDFNVPGEPHGFLADLPLPIYITTNYDDFMVRALRSRDKDPRQELCRWNKLVKDSPSIFKQEPGFKPSVANPLVFHLHGHIDLPDSMVLTEDDYLDFLVEISRKRQILPKLIQGAFSGTSLLFLGYRLADWDFRVLFRHIVTHLETSIQRAHVSVQLTPGKGKISEEQQEKARRYLDKYFEAQKIHVYWGTCEEFIADLKTRWEVPNNE